MISTFATLLITSTFTEAFLLSLTISVTVGTEALHLKMFENYKEFKGQISLSGPVIICIENDQASKLNQEQIVKNFVVHKT